MTMIKAGYSNLCLDSYQSEKYYGEWWADYSFSVDSVSISDEKRYEGDSEKFNLDVEVGDIVYVVYITYSDGDSFGRSTGKGEVVWMYKEKRKAEDCAESVEKFKGRYSINIETEDGQVVSWSNPCSDYFSQLEDVVVKEMIVE